MTHQKVVPVAVAAVLLGGVLIPPVTAIAKELPAVTEAVQGANEGASAQSDDLVDGDFTYVVSSGLAKITGYSGTSSQVEIPSTLGGYQVASIGSYAFQGKTNITSVSFPVSLQEIGWYAFSGCTGLDSLVLPVNLHSLGIKAFENCTGLTSVRVESKGLSNTYSLNAFDNAGIGASGIEVTFGPLCRSVPDGLFYSYAGKAPNITKVTIPPTVTRVGYHSFGNLANLQEVVIEEGSGLKTLGTGAFASDSSLKSIVLPESLSRLDDDVFAGCSSLESLHVDSRSLEIHSNGAFKNAGVSGPGIEVTFGAGVTEIPARLLYSYYESNPPKVKSVTIPASVTKIGSKGLGTITNYTIYGYKGTVAASYARDHGIPFVSLGSVSSFTDVSSDAWYYKPVMYAADNMLITGYGNGLFGPNDTLTRAQAAVILHRFFVGEDSGESRYNTTGMSDVEGFAYYTQAANWAVKNGIINGMERGGRKYFDPNGAITRQQLCAIIANAASKLNGANIATADQSRLNSMPDGSAVDGWARQSVAWSLEKGVISGVAIGNSKYVSPNLPVTRATMAAVMMNAIEGGTIKK